MGKYVKVTKESMKEMSEDPSRSQEERTMAGNWIADFHETTQKDVDLIYAIHENQIDKVKQAVVNGANIRRKSYKPLGFAAGSGHLDIVKYLVNEGSNINISMSAIHAANMGHLEVLKYLVEKGFNLSNFNGRNFLEARLARYTEVLSYLETKGVEIEKDRLGRPFKEWNMEGFTKNKTINKEML